MRGFFILPRIGRLLPVRCFLERNVSIFCGGEEFPRGTFHHTLRPQPGPKNWPLEEFTSKAIPRRLLALSISRLSNAPITSTQIQRQNDHNSRSSMHHPIPPPRLRHPVAAVGGGGEGAGVGRAELHTVAHQVFFVCSLCRKLGVCPLGIVEGK